MKLTIFMMLLTIIIIIMVIIGTGIQLKRMIKLMAFKGNKLFKLHEFD